MRRETLSGKSWIVRSEERTAPVTTATRSRRGSGGRGQPRRPPGRVGAAGACAFLGLPDKEYSCCSGLPPAVFVLSQLALARGESLPLLVARLLVMLVLAGFFENAGLLDLF